MQSVYLAFSGPPWQRSPSGRVMRPDAIEEAKNVALGRLKDINAGVVYEGEMDGKGSTGDDIDGLLKPGRHRNERKSLIFTQE